MQSNITEGLNILRECASDLLAQYSVGNVTESERLAVDKYLAEYDNEGSLDEVRFQAEIERRAPGRTWHEPLVLDDLKEYLELSRKHRGVAIVVNRVETETFIYGVECLNGVAWLVYETSEPDGWGKGLLAAVFTDDEGKTLCNTEPDDLDADEEAPGFYWMRLSGLGYDQDDSGREICGYRIPLQLNGTLNETTVLCLSEPFTDLENWLPALPYSENLWYPIDVTKRELAVRRTEGDTTHLLLINSVENGYSLRVTLSENKLLLVEAICLNPEAVGKRLLIHLAIQTEPPITWQLSHTFQKMEEGRLWVIPLQDFMTSGKESFYYNLCVEKENEA